jgi:hypothetical protein
MDYFKVCVAVECKARLQGTLPNFLWPREDFLSLSPYSYMKRILKREKLKADLKYFKKLIS